MADRSQAGRLDDRVVYQPSADELAEAVAILVGCGAVRVAQHGQVNRRLFPHREPPDAVVLEFITKDEGKYSKF